METQLPIEKSKKNLSYEAQKIGMIGAAGIGKSSFFAQDPKAFFIEAEQGLNFLEVFKMPARSWDDLRDIYELLNKAAKSGNFPYSIIVWDTIDRIVDLAEEEIVTRAKEFYKRIAEQINCVGDIPNGRGWGLHAGIVKLMLNKFEELPCAIAYIGHLKTKTFKDGVREFNKDTISIGAQVGSLLLSWPDHLLHVKANMVGDNLKRVVYTKPTQSMEAKSREGVVPNGITWGDSMKDNYNEFRKLFT